MSKSISKNAIFKAVLNMFNIILPIIVMPLLTRSLGKDLYGYYGYGDSLTGYFLIFAGFGISQYGLREISKVRDYKEKLESTFTSLFLITTITNVLASASYMLYVWICYKDEPFYYTCLILGFNIVSNTVYVEWVNEALENYNFIAIKTMIVRIIYSALILLFVRSKESYMFYLVLVVGFNFLNNIISFVYIKGKIKFNFSNLHLLSHIKPMIYVVILSNTGMLYTQLDKIMLKDTAGGTVSVGYYYAAQRIMTIIYIFLMTIIQVTMPRLSNYLGNDSKDKYISLLTKVIRIYFMLLFPAAIGLLCLSREVISVFGSEFMPAVPVLIVFSIYMISLGIEGIIANQIIYLHRMEKYDAVLVLAGGIINLILNVVLSKMNKLDMVTAIVTTLIANVIIIFLEYMMVKTKIKLDIRIFSFHNMKYLYYALLFIPITWLVKLLNLNMIITCFVVVVLCGLSYALILTFTKDEIYFELLGKVLKKIKK
ncbi:MAG: flippase [Clostridium butyricum]|nr:flippase [Clostridium butyricum]